MVKNAQFRCKTCAGETLGQRLAAREMMFGTHEEFFYLECADCLSLQIETIPEDLARHYPSGYLTANASRDAATYPARPPSLLRRFLRRQRTNYLLNRRGLFGRLALALGEDYFPYDWKWFRQGQATPKSRILDVGCGTGLLLSSLTAQGFLDLTGQDLYQKDVEPGVRVLKTPLHEIAETFDFIMLHHSLEHMPNPLVALEQIQALLRPDGRILVRIPVASSAAWHEYGTNWFQLDAPRHLVIPSNVGMQILAARAGLDVLHIDFDSDARQFGCSEQYRRGVPLKAKQSFFSSWRTGENDIFTAKEIDEFERKAKHANAAGTGDQACFYLKRRDRN